MESNTKDLKDQFRLRWPAYAAILVVVVLAGLGLRSLGLRSLGFAAQPGAPAPAEAIAIPKPGAIPPPAGFLRKADEQRALVERIGELQKQHGIAELIQQANKLAQELNGSTPENMEFNRFSRHFEWKRGFEPKPPPAAVPAPAPIAEKK